MATPVCLGLQGAGTYGAFTWGVLDRLLDEDDFAIDSISGASSGAINAVVLADGYACGGGRRGAQQALRHFWTALGQSLALTPLQPSLLDRWRGRWTMEYSPAYQLLEFAGVMAGPVRETPLTHNPLRIFLSTHVDFARVRACKELQLFIAATNVSTGDARIFTRKEMDVQRVLASACLPTVFAAVEVDGETYWDGSYVANPPLTPFLLRDAGDVIVVQNNPAARSELPRTMADIGNRSDEIAFNVSFMRELTACRHARSRFHLISGADMLSECSISSKLNGEPAFLQHLHARGVETAERWLREHAHKVGAPA